MRPLVGVFALLGVLPLPAKVVLDGHTGSEITVPDDWKTTMSAPTAKGFTAHATDPKEATSVDLIVDDATMSGPLIESSKFVQDAIRDAQTKGELVTGRGPKTLNGTTFLVLNFTTKPAAPKNFMNAWFTTVDGHACEIAFSSKAADPGKDDGLNGIAKSFAVLTAQDRLDEKLRDDPFSFYGKVIDQNGNPLPGASVKILAQREMGKAQDETEHDVQTDTDGLFQLSDIHSFGVVVQVAKDGYFMAPGAHEPRWNWLTDDTATTTMPTKDAPAVFLLQAPQTGE